MSAGLATILAPADDDTDDVPPPFGLPRHPPVARVRRRPDAPDAPSHGMPPTASPGAAEAHPTETTDPTVAHLRRVLAMRVEEARGQEEVATIFGVAVRTVRRWEKRARELEVKTFTRKSGAAIAADLDAKFHREYAEWCQTIAEAKAAGDLKLKMEAQRGRQQCSTQHAHALARLGVIGPYTDPAVRPQHVISEDSVEHSRKQLGLLLDMQFNSLSGNEAAAEAMTFGPSTGTTSDEDDDFEPIYG